MRPQVGRERVQGRMDGTTLISLYCTSIAAPSQWEGQLADGRFIYVRYRHGRGAVRVGNSAEQVRQSPIGLVFDGDGRATNADPFGGEAHGNEHFLDGFLSTNALLDLLIASGMDVADARIVSATD